MTRLAKPAAGTLRNPLPIATVPFVDTIEVEAARCDPDEPSPCLPTATATWYVLNAERAGFLVFDLAGSTPLDPVVRLYRRARTEESSLTFAGCASPVWNAQRALELAVLKGEALLAQVGTSESHAGRIVVRVELRSTPWGPLERD